MKKAIILTHSGFKDHEVIYPYHSLKENKFEPTIVADKLGRFYGILGCHMVGDVLIKEFENPEVRLEYLKYDLLIIPGGVKALEKLILCKNIFSLISHRICIEFASLDKVLQRSCVAFLCSL